MKWMYFAPGDIQIARVERQMLVYFCEALYQLGVDIELVAMGIKLMDGELMANHPLQLYRIKERFPVRIVKVPVHQESNDYWWTLNRLWVHVTEGIKLSVTAGRNKRVVFYIRNFASALVFLLMRAFLKT
ncbi:MAG: hypothetical protein ACRENG_05665, partial [bacterium]